MNRLKAGRSALKTTGPSRPVASQPSATRGDTRQPAGLTPTQSMILQLQRTGGNTAVNALLQRYARAGAVGPGDGVGNRRTSMQRRAGAARQGGPVSLQRWPTNTPTLDWSQTQRITALQS